MTAFTTEVARLAVAEHQRWNTGAKPGKETDDPYSGYVAQYWSIGLHNGNINGRTTYQNAKGKSYRPAWSSAFISFIMRKAGAGSEFYYSEAHTHYVVKGIRDAAVPNPTAKFLGRDPAAYAPKVGDLINAGRDTAKDVTYATILARYGSSVVPHGHFLPSHSDIVVEVRAGRLTTIGGNVAVDTVGSKTWKLDQNGRLLNAASLICVIECLL